MWTGRGRLTAAASVALAALIVAAVAVAVSNAASTVSTTVTFGPTDDTYISQAAPTTNYGAASSMTTGGATKKIKRVYLRFAVSGVPADATVTGARLVLTALNSSGVRPTLKRQTAGSWSESTLTYANAPALGTNITSPSAVKAGPVTFQVQNVVKGNGTFSFGMVQGSSKETNWSTKEGASAPQLIVTYSQPAPTPSVTPTVSPTPIPSAGEPCGTATDPPPATYDHVIWIMMENKYYNEVVGDRTNAPYINSLVDACGTVQGQQDASGGTDIDSLPNYIAYTSGGTQGLTVNDYPANTPVHADNLFRQVLSAGLTTKSYAESMPANCTATDNGTSSELYRVKHNPWPYYVDDADACKQFNVPMGTTTSGAFHDDLTAGTLPSFALITPNMVSDMHNGGTTVAAKVRNGDGWLQQWMPLILGSDTYKAGRTAVFLLWDEFTPCPNLFIAPWIHPGTVVPAPVDPAYSHYSVLRTTEEMLGITTFLGNAETAPSLRTALNF